MSEELEQALEKIEEYYRAQGMAQRLGFGRHPALLVVDLQKGITDPQRPAGCDLNREIENTAVLLRAMRERELPIFYFVIAYHESLIDGGLIVRKLPALRRFKEQSDDTQVDPRLKPRAQEPVIGKNYASCFHGTSLAAMLRVQEVDTVIITGCITSGCIRATANDALQHGFRPIIPRECVGDRSPIPHKVNLMDMQARCGDVVALKEVVEYLERKEDKR